MPMKKFLNDIRSAENPISGNRKIINTIAVLFLGIAWGLFQNFWIFVKLNCKCAYGNRWALDVHNFLGRFAIWVLIALCISIYSNSATRASVNVFAFFCWHGCKLLFVFKLCRRLFPKSYAMIWVGFTMISPFLAFVCWYAKGKSRPASLHSVYASAPYHRHANGRSRPGL